MTRIFSKFGKATRLALAVIVMSGAGVALSSPSAAQQAQSGTVIGFVNLQEVGQKAKAAVAAGQEIENYRTTVEGRIREREDELREEEQALGRRRSILAPDAFRAEEAKFREGVDLAQREFQQIGRQLQQATIEAQQIINEQMSKVIRDIAIEQGINIVLNQGQVTFIQPLEQYDITAAVIERVDQVLPEITVNLPQL
jgi:Skp family chaperone for outer membrane proteins